MGLGIDLRWREKRDAKKDSFRGEGKVRAEHKFLDLHNVWTNSIV